MVSIQDDDDFYIVPRHGNGQKLSWHRETQRFHICDDDRKMPSGAHSMPSLAIFGVLSLTPVQNVLITVSGAAKVGTLPGNHSVYLVTRLSWRLLPGLKVPPSPIHGTTPKSSLQQCEQLPADVLSHYITLIRRFCACRDANEGTHFYFSNSSDLASPFDPLSAPRSSVAPSPVDGMRDSPQTGLAAPVAEPLSSSMIFQWNRRLTAAFPSSFSKVLPCVVRGYIGIKKLKDSTISVALCSRQSVRHAGTRYNARGIDDLGVPANFILSEQVVWNRASGLVSSYRLLRGSIPRRWEQPADLTFKPRATISSNESARDEVVLHMGMLGALYGDCEFHCVDTTSMSALELPLSCGFAAGVAEYDEQVKNALSQSPHKRIPRCLYTKINIGSKISTVSLEELSEELTRLLGASQSKFGVSSWHLDGAVSTRLHEQQGYFRVNCLDCLDRTNVTQALLARHALAHQLDACDLAAAKHEVAGAAMKLWMENGTAISHLYAGTDPHFLDFIATGRRSAAGHATSGRIALQRYFQANFRDGPKHDTIALITGAHDAQTACTSEGSPFQRRMTGLNALVLFGLLFAFASLVLCGTVMFFFTTRWRVQLAMLQVVWVSFIGAAFYWIRRHAHSFTNYPILK